MNFQYIWSAIGCHFRLVLHCTMSMRSEHVLTAVKHVCHIPRASISWSRLRLILLQPNVKRMFSMIQPATEMTLQKPRLSVKTL